MQSDEVTVEQGIPVTTVSRTLFDLAAVLPRHQVERALNEAQVQRLGGDLSVADILERYPRRWGAPVIRAILADGVTVIRSELEARFQSLVAASHLPRPDFNAWISAGGRWFECDCVWRDRRVVVELDGWAAHGTVAAFERDRVRDRVLHAAGWRLARVTWRQLRDEPEAVLYDLRALLSFAAGTAAAWASDGVSSNDDPYRSLQGLP